MSKQFIWRSESCYTRSREGVKGVALERDAVYNVSDFDEAVVNEWVRSGAAEFTTAKAKKDKEG